MIFVSTGFKHQLFSGTSFASLFNGGCIEVRSGPSPGSAGLAPTGTLLARITQGGGAHANGSPVNGLNFTVSDLGVVMPALGANWIITGLANGTAGWCRLRGVTDTSLDSSTLARIDFDVNPEDDIGLHMPDAAITVATQRPCTFFMYGIPPFE